MDGSDPLAEWYEQSIKALALYALASKKRLRGIEHGVKAARHVARRAGRDQVTFADIKQAIRSGEPYVGLIQFPPDC